MFTCDVTCDFYNWTEPVAHKEHKCCECVAPIRKGEKHLHWRGKWDGDFSSGRQHLLCCEACEVIRDNINHECIPFGMLRDYMSECGNYIREAARGGCEHSKRLRSLFAQIRQRERLG